MSPKIRTFMVAKQNVLNSMSTHKVKNIFSEIGTFFKENDAKSAMNTIMDSLLCKKYNEYD